VLPGRKYTPEDVVAIAWRRKWLIVLTVGLLTSAAVGASLRLPNLYQSETLILVIPQRVPESYVRSTVTVRIEDRLRSITPQILTRTRLERIIEDFNLYAEERKARPMEQIVAAMRSNVFVDTVRDDAFKVRFVSESPRNAMIVADRLATMFIEENLRDRELQATGTNEFLESQLDDARRRLIMHEQKLEAYRKQYSGELPSQLQANLQVLQSTQAQIQDLTESINRDRDRRLELEKSLAEATANGDSATAPLTVPTETTDLMTQLDKAQAELREMQARRRPEHPDVIAKGRVVRDLQQKLRDLTLATPAASADRPLTSATVARLNRERQYQAEIERLDQQVRGKEAEMQRLRQVMSDYQQRVEAVPGHESELTALMRDYETLQKIYQDLLGKKENSQISANLEREQVGEQFRIIDPARLPVRPFSPDRVQITGIAFILSMMVAFGITAFLEYRDSTLRSEDEIVRTFSLPVLAAIPVLTAVAEVRRRKRNKLLLAAAGVILASGISVVLWQLSR
jgi:polysaccharide chain length determinant protein (PEP-CTERM system associated)